MPSAKTRKRERGSNNNNNNVASGSIKRARPPQPKKVLVLCQRKTAEGAKNEEYVKDNVKRINDYIKDYFKTDNIEIEYLSGMGDRKGGVDYHFDFGNNSETKNFVKEHKNEYSMIILYTCPFVIFVNSEFILHNLNLLLIKDGVLVFKNHIKDSLNNILEPKHPNRNNHFKFYKREPFTNYFRAIDTDNEGSMIFTKYNKNNNTNRTLKRNANHNQFLKHLDHLSDLMKHRKL